MKYIIIILFFIFPYVKLSAQGNNEQKKLDSKYIQFLDSLSKKDQKVRGNKYLRANMIYLKYQKDSLLSPDSKEYKQAFDLKYEWMTTDSSNIYSLISYIDKNGFPSKIRVGEIGYRNAFIIMLHFDEDTNNVVLKPILEKYLENGEIESTDFAKIIDRHHSRDGKQVYYEWNPCLFKTLNKDEKEKVLLARKKIGLGSKSFKCTTFGKKEKIE